MNFCSIGARGREICQCKTQRFDEKVFFLSHIIKDICIISMGLNIFLFIFPLSLSCSDAVREKQIRKVAKDEDDAEKRATA